MGKSNFFPKKELIKLDELPSSYLWRIKNIFNVIMGGVLIKQNILHEQQKNN